MAPKASPVSLACESIEMTCINRLHKFDPINVVMTFFKKYFNCIGTICLTTSTNNRNTAFSRSPLTKWRKKNFVSSDYGAVAFTVGIGRAGGTGWNREREETSRVAADQFSRDKLIDGSISLIISRLCGANRSKKKHTTTFYILVPSIQLRRYRK